MPKLLFLYVVGTALFMLTGRPALAVDQSTIDQVVNVAKIGCLLGNEFTFDAKANGDITFTKLKPGAEVGVHTNIKEDPGAPGIIDQQLKIVATQQIRDCMKPYVQKLAELILGQASGNQITSIDASAALELGDCPETLQLLQPDPGQIYRCSCPASIAGGSFSNKIYGASVYMLLSPVCKAALHAGALKRGRPGQILFHLVPAPPVFKSTTQNGIHSDGWASQQEYGFVVAPSQ
jgi:LCCL domain